MNRVQLDQLVIVNWRGVFYQEYDLDQLITSLTGLNGAGKTTVMAAAYVAMLPDQSLLDFRQGPASAGNSKKGGLWGRFGKGTVSYSAISYKCPKDKRIIIGVQVRKKSEPDFELIPFVIEGLEKNFPLVDLFLTRDNNQETIIDSDTATGLKGLDQRVKLAGGKLRAFKGRVGEYMATLFEHHITPLRFAKSGERRKLNKLLQTSLFGGLSSEIQQSLKDYLLDKDATISSQVQRAESNLEACKQTRMALERTRYQREFIEGVFTHTNQLASIHLADLEESYLEKRQEAIQARRDYSEHLIKSRNQEEELNLLKEKLETLSHQEEEAIEEKKSLEDTASKLESLEKLYEEQRLLKEKLDEESANSKLLKSEVEVLESQFQRAVTEETQVEKQYDEIIGQLLDQDQAIETEAKKASLYNAAKKTKTEVENEFSTTIDSDSIETYLEEANHQIEKIRDELASQDRHAAVYEHQRKSYDAALAWLNRIEESDSLKDIFKIDPQNTPFERASSILRHSREQELKAASLGNLEAQLNNLEKQNTSKKEILKFISEAYNYENIDKIDSEAFQNIFEDFSNQIEEIKREQIDLEDQIEEQKIHIEHQNDDLASAKKRIKDFERGEFIVSRLKALGLSIPKEESAIHNLRQEVRTQKLTLDQEKIQTLSKQSTIEEELKALQECRVFKDQRLVDLAASVGGDLVADLFESVSIQEAAETEAKLGELRDAIHCDDPNEIIEELLKIEDRPDHVLITNARKLIAEQKFEQHGDSYVIHNSDGIRISKLSQKPVIGSDAREKQIERLSKQLERVEKRLLDAEVESRRWEEAESFAIELSHVWDTLHAGNPEDEISYLTESIEVGTHKLEGLQRSLEEIEEKLSTASKFKNEWDYHSQNSWVLDQENLEEDLENCIKLVDDARLFAESMAEAAAWLKELDLHHHALSSPPTEVPSSEDIEELKNLLDTWRHKKSLLEKFDELKSYLNYQQSESRLNQDSGFLEGLSEDKKKLEGMRLQLRKNRSEVEEKLGDAKSRLKTAQTLAERYSGEISDREKIVKELGGIKLLTRKNPNLKKLQRTIETIEEITLQKTENKASQRQINSSIKKNVQNKVELLEVYKAKRANWLPKAFEKQALKRTASQKIDLLKNQILMAKDLSSNLKSSKANTAAIELKRLIQKDKSAFLGIRELLEQIIDKGLGGNALNSWKIYDAIFTELSTHLPRDIVQSEDPMAALKDMIHYCERLQMQLTQQERSLATSTFDVAQAIDQKIRREFRNISKLNEGLDKVRFGSIRAIRIKYGKKAGMDEVLKALKDEGNPQPMLISEGTKKSFAEVLGMIYEQKVGRKFTGDSLLDYRYYLDLSVQVRRASSDQWESVDSNRLSTGESIGVGISVLIMVLQSWEHQTTRLLGFPRNSSRFLFLDEASRLDSSSINTLGVLCKQMQLQLMIAAPSADKAICGTTYCLNRVVAPDGTEQVLVRGIRGFRKEDEGPQTEEETGLAEENITEKEDLPSPTPTAPLFPSSIEAADLQ